MGVRLDILTLMVQKCQKVKPDPITKNHILKLLVANFDWSRATR